MTWIERNSCFIPAVKKKSVKLHSNYINLAIKQDIDVDLVERMQKDRNVLQEE